MKNAKNENGDKEPQTNSTAEGASEALVEIPSTEKERQEVAREVVVYDEDVWRFLMSSMHCKNGKVFYKWSCDLRWDATRSAV